MKSGLVSVVIPAYNAGEQLREAIESVLRQTYKDLEVIVVNDGSPKSITEETVLSIKDPRIKYIKQENKGNFAARNRGMQEAQGEFIAHLDQDDLWVEDKLEKQVALFNANKELGYCCTDHYIFYNDDPKKIHFDQLHTYLEAFGTRDGLIRELIRDNFVILSSVMLRSECVARLGGFDTWDNFALDYEFNLRMFLNYPAFYMKDRLVLRRIHAMNVSNKSVEMLESVLYGINKIYTHIQNYKFYEPRQKELIEKKIRQTKYELGVEYLCVKNYPKALEVLRESGYAEKGLSMKLALFIARWRTGLLIPLIKLYRSSKKSRYVVPTQS